MYADHHALLELADQLRARARAVRRLAAAADHDTATVEWHGAAAEAMRRAARRGQASLLALADHHDRAADLLDEHAHRVGERLEVVLGVLHWLERAA